MKNARATEDLSTQWFVAGRIHQYGTELRLGILRLFAIALLYAIHLVGFLTNATPTEEERRFHWSATLLAIAWLVFGIVLLGMLLKKSFPRWTGLATTIIDLVFLVAVATLGQKANSPLVVVLFLILIAAALRFDLRLVWITTLGCLASYLFLLAAGDPGSWFDSERAVPVTTELLMLASITIGGLLCGQIVRRIRSMMFEFAKGESM